MNEQTYPWYMVNKDGMCTLCADQADAEQEAKNAQDVWPHMGPHRAVRLVEASQAFTAAEAAGWLPIETAPKDGSAVLVHPPTWDDSARTCSVATYNLDQYAMKPRPYWERDDAMGKVGYSRDKPPTHWRPLPPAPSTEGESGNGVAP